MERAARRPPDAWSPLPVERRQDPEVRRRLSGPALRAFFRHRPRLEPDRRPGARAARVAAELDLSQVQERRFWCAVVRHADAVVARARHPQSAAGALPGAGVRRPLGRRMPNSHPLFGGRPPHRLHDGRRHRRVVPGPAAPGWPPRIARRSLESPGRRTCRLVPSRYPPVGLFDQRRVGGTISTRSSSSKAGRTIACPGELGLLTNVPREEWVRGSPMASVVMAPFCHLA